MGKGAKRAVPTSHARLDVAAAFRTIAGLPNNIVNVLLTNRADN